MSGPHSAQRVLDRRAQAPPPRTLIDILRETTARHPEASALDDGSGALSYRELMALVGRTAARLHDAGVRRGDRVGVRVASGSKELYVSILGVLAAGAAYVPVDADDPDERARLVFGEAQVRGGSSATAACTRATSRQSDAASATAVRRRGAAPEHARRSSSCRRRRSTTTRGSSSPRARPACPRASR